MIAWTGATIEPWRLSDQCRACGLEVPTVTPQTWTFLAARLVVHRCVRADCRECREAKRLGWRTLRLTAEPVDRLAYVSCDPAPLARDLHRLNVNYQIAAVRAFDLFLQTADVETVVVLEAA